MKEITKCGQGSDITWFREKYDKKITWHDFQRKINIFQMIVIYTSLFDLKQIDLSMAIFI